MKSILKITHTLFTIALALFFIYAGVKKFIPKNHHKAQNNTEMIQAIENNEFQNPIPFKLSVKMLKVSGFLKFVGVLQIIAGILMIIPQSRLVGTIFLLPITLNIFAFHLFMDNRMDENVETGLFLLLNLLLLIAYYSKVKLFFKVKL